MTRRNVLAAGFGSLAAVSLGGLYESSRLQVIRKTLKLPRWDAEGFRVAQISDVHLNHDHAQAIAEEAVRTAIRENPDLIVFTGDFLNDGTDTNLARIEQVFRLLEDAHCPAFACLGNHDYGCRATEEVVRRVAKTPLRLLRNEVADFDGVSIVGFDDGFWTSPPVQLAASPGLSKSRLVLWHEPDCVERLPAVASLMLSGHSHGGEICLPGGIPLLTPTLAKRHVAGYYGSGPVPVFVSKGTATSGPCRTFCPPDIAILTLRSA